MRRAEYLQCRRGRWFVRVRVPANLVVQVGQIHFVRSLDTDGEAQASASRWVALVIIWDGGLGSGHRTGTDIR
ncbi:DUF6538 domain-containing protein [Methylobacterium sp.]|uniref:DUF6538 domain-containing protein n=1 Tax=Methylobacterium sp. TaxID=409 RepID=UPI003454ABB0